MTRRRIVRRPAADNDVEVAAAYIAERAQRPKTGSSMPCERPKEPFC